MKTTKKLHKEAEIAVQFFQEVIRTDKVEMIIGCTNAIFDAVLSIIVESNYKKPLLQVYPLKNQYKTFFPTYIN